jgi:hypothetical protein
MNRFLLHNKFKPLTWSLGTMEFSLGSKVREVGNTNTGTVIATELLAASQTSVIVSWDKPNSSGATLTIIESSILELVDTELEKDFAAVRHSLQQAANHIAAAAHVMSGRGLLIKDFTWSEDNLSIRDLMDAIDEAGWRTSSLEC